MSGKIKAFIVVSVMALAIFAFVIASAQDNSTVGNTTTTANNSSCNTTAMAVDPMSANVAPMVANTASSASSGAASTSIMPPQSYTPDIELQTNYISDNVEAGQTYVYKVQVKNVGNKDVTIEPRFNAGYPMVYGATGASGVVPNAENVSVDNNTTPMPVSTPMPASAPTSASVPMVTTPAGIMANGMNGQAFGNDAVNVSAPSTIAVGEIVDMIITVTVPDNATGNYYSSIDMNVNNVENNYNNPQLSLNFNVMNKLTASYTKNFTVPVDSSVQIEVTADVYNSNDAIRVSPPVETPSFNVNVTQNGAETNLVLNKTAENENVGVGVSYPTWTSVSNSNYQNFGSRYINTYTAKLSAGDYQLNILPKGITNFGYTITQNQ